MARRQPRRSRRPGRAGSPLSSLRLSIEALESRCLLSVAPLDSEGVGVPPPAVGSAPPSAVGDVMWNGKRTVAYRDSYIVQMPTTQVRDQQGHLDYASAAPAAAPGWLVQNVGFGFYSVVAPDVSTDTVQQWAASVGAVSVEPNVVLVKQALVVGPPTTQLPVVDPGLTGDAFYASYLWGLNNTGAAGLSRESRAASNLGNGPNIYPRSRDADIDAPEAWYLQTGNREVVVAVFDDGIDDTNPDLNANMWNRDRANAVLQANGQELIPTPAQDPNLGVDTHGFNSAEWRRDPNFYEGSPTYPKSTYPTFRSTRPGDPALITKQTDPVTGKQWISWKGANDAHGTHVAGIIGAGGNNGTGVTGVSWAVSLYSANIFRYGDYNQDGYWVAAEQSGSVLAFVDAAWRVFNLKQRFDQNIVVANLSFNTYNGGASAAMEGAIQWLNDAGILVVVAAGNGYDPEFRDGVGDAIATEPYPLNDCPTYPASYRVPNMIVVTASDAQDKLPRFANWGPNVDIAAPGVNIMSTVPRSARAYNPGDSLVQPSLKPTDVPVQYDSHEPIGLFAPPEPDPPAPSPPGTWGLAGLTERGYVAQDAISRPYSYRELVTPQYPSDGNPYAVMSGTSMSAAYVSGTAALMAAEFYRWTGSMPEGAYLKQGILTQADSVATLTYEEGSNFPPNDYSFKDPITGNPIARTGMYETTTDPEPRTHSIPGNLRLNTGKCIYWVRDNLPPSVAIAPRPESDADLGESRLEGDFGLTPFYYALTYVRGTGVFSGINPTGTITLETWTQDIGFGPNFARAGVDYDPVPKGTTFDVDIGAPGLTFPVSLENLFAVNVIGDENPENNESFRLNFRIRTNALNTANVWCKTRAVADTIIDDDPTNGKPVVRWNLQTLTISEPKPTPSPQTAVPRPVITNRELMLTLDRPASRAVVVPYRTYELRNATGVNPTATEGIDYIGVSRTATIPAGQTSVVVPVSIVVDRKHEGADEKFWVATGAPNLGVRKRGGVRAEVTIVDGDDPIVPVTPTTVECSITGPTETVLEGGMAKFTVQLTDKGTNLPYVVPTGVGSSMLVYYTVSGANTTGVAPATLGSDFRGPASQMLTIPAGSSSGTISVATLADRLIEPDEAFVVRISRIVPTGAVLLKQVTDKLLSLQLAGGTGTVGTATIVDTPAVAISGPNSLVFAGGLATFLVDLTNSRGQVYPVPAGCSVRVNYAIINGTARVGTDFTGPVTGSIVIPEGNSAGTIDVQTIAQAVLVEKSFSVRITGVSLLRGTTTQPLNILGSPLATATIART